MSYWLGLPSQFRRRIALRAPRTACVAAAIILTARLVLAQEALWSPLAGQVAAENLRQSIAGEAAAEARRIRPESIPYTFKSGDFRLLVNPSLGLDWNDNINLSDADTREDFILKPRLQLDASYPVTDRNLLGVTAGVGYDHYFHYDGLSDWVVLSGSELSFDVYIKDFWINLHNRFSYTQDPAAQAEVANTTEYVTVNNTAGLLTTWDLQDVTLSLGYDHANSWYPNQQSDSQDRATELIVGRAGLRMHPRVTTGVEGTVAITTYDEPVLNDNTGYSAGVYADWQPGPYFRVQPRAGYVIYQFDQTSRRGFQQPGQPVETSDVDSWYAGLNLTHAITDTVSYSLDAGHEVRLGSQGADAVEDSYVRANVSWRIVRNLTLTTSLFYEHGEQGQGNETGNLTETYDHYGGSLGLRYPLMKRLSLSLNYRLTLRSSDSADRDYTQNLVGFLLTYNLP